MKMPDPCDWCGQPVPGPPYTLRAVDPTTGDDLLLTACSSEHREQLRDRFRH